MTTVLILPAIIITGCYTLIICIIWRNSHLLATDKPKQIDTAEKKSLVPPQENYTNGRLPTLSSIFMMDNGMDFTCKVQE